MKIEKGSCSIKVHRRELVSLKFMCYFITVVVLRKDIYRIKLTPMPYLLRIRIQAASDKYPQSRDSCARLAILNVVILFGLFIYLFILNGREIWSAFAFNFLIQSDIESKCLSCTCLSHEGDCVKWWPIVPSAALSDVLHSLGTTCSVAVQSVFG